MRSRLTPMERRQIRTAIAMAERGHRGEIAVHVEPRYPGDGPAGRAAALFEDHGLHRTRDGTGVLLYVAELDRKVAVHAGPGVFGAHEPQRWQAVCDAVARGYAAGDRLAGLRAGLDLLRTILHETAPGPDDAGDELANEVHEG